MIEKNNQICIINKVLRLLAAISSAHLKHQVSWPVDWSGPLTVVNRTEKLPFFFFFFVFVGSLGGLKSGIQRAAGVKASLRHNQEFKKQTEEKQASLSVLQTVGISALFMEKKDKLKIIIFFCWIWL